MEKLDGLSMNMEQGEREKLRSIFPGCFAEGRLDMGRLLGMCGEYVDDDFERYEFRWKGKSECLRLAAQRSTGTLRPCPEESVNFDDTQNLYIEGDNLEVLKLLQTAYYRSVKMIYIDPPYNTGNDFIYEDDFADTLARYREVTRQTTRSNPESMGRFHTNWLNMIYPRLRLAANLLRDDGVILISIDDNEVHNLRKVCDEVFGEENFAGSILWKKKTNGNNMGIIPPVHDYIIAYAKNTASISEIGYVKTKDFFENKYSNPDNDPRGPWDVMDLSANHQGPHFTITNPDTGEKFSPPEGRFWVFNEEEVLKRIADGRIIFGKSGKARPVQKVFASEREKGKIRAESWWDRHGMNEDATTELKELFGKAKLFTHPKPSMLIHHLVKIATEQQASDIVLDFFSGSATTAHAVMQMNREDGGNRRFILVQLPEPCPENSEAFRAGYKNICEIGKERIRRAGKKLSGADGRIPLLESPPADTGFKVFKLDSSNLKIWDGTPVADENLLTLAERMNGMIDRVKPERGDLDVVYEIMLKLGVPPTCGAGKITVAGKTAYAADGGAILICLAPDITPEIIGQMADLAPARIVLAERCLADDTALANAHYILQDRNIDLKLV